LHRLPIYLKLGFEILFPRSDKRHAVWMSQGFTCHPIFLNFSSLIINRKSESDSKFNFGEQINRYLAERWYKRTVLRYYWNSKKEWPWIFNLREIRSLLDETHPA
jgi:hypothetical protein